MQDYGVTFDTTPPDRFDRGQLLLRVVILLVLSGLAGAFGWLFGFIYLGIPVLAAILISQKGPSSYLTESRDNMTKWLHYIIGFYAYLSLLTDRLPTSDAILNETVRFDVRPAGSPSVGNALLRIIFAIPSAFVLGLLWLVGGILIVIAAISILATETYPSGIYGFLLALNRWETRLLAYLASLVDQYPPFSIETEPLNKASAERAS